MFANFAYNYQLHVGKACEILVPQSRIPIQHASHILVQLYVFLPNLHARLHVPCLELGDRYVVVDPKVCPWHLLRQYMGFNMT